MNSVIIVGGSKGGVGKSFVSMGLIDVLLQTGKEVFVIDCDSTNPDIFLPYEETEVECILRPLDNEDSAIKIGELIEKHPDSCIVINSAARSKLCENIGILIDVCRESKRELLTFWPINQERDSLQLAMDYHDVCEGTPMYVVLNTHFGEEDDFDTYNNSKFKTSVNTVAYPALTKSVVKKINFNRLNYQNAETAKDKNGEPIFRIAEKSALFRFRHKIKDVLSGIFEGR